MKLRDEWEEAQSQISAILGEKQAIKKQILRCRVAGLVVDCVRLILVVVILVCALLKA